MNDLEEFIRENFNDRFAVYCGAGISFNSGIPTVPYIIKELSEQLLIDKNDLEEINNSKVPFEAKIETIFNKKSVFDIYKFFEIFSNGFPNTNHDLISRLAEIGMITDIYTTNFDTLLEKALTSKKVSFTTYFQDTDFANLYNVDKGVKIIKLHGTISKPETVITTIRSVAARNLIKGREIAIDYLFDKNDCVLFLGYSFSDIFDLQPAIRKHIRKSKKIIILQHSDSFMIEKLDYDFNTDNINSFVIKLYANTDKFIQLLYEKFFADYELTKFSFEWKKIITDALNSNDINQTYNKHRTAFILFNQIGLPWLGLKYCKKALSSIHIQNSKDFDKQYAANVNYASSLIDNFNYNEASIVLSKLHTNINKLGRSLFPFYMTYSNYYWQQCYYEEALNYSRKALVSANDDDDILSANINLSYCLVYLNKDIEEAVELATKAIEISKNIGDINLQVYSMQALAGCYEFIDIEKSIITYENSLILSKNIGNLLLQEISCSRLATIAYNRGEISKALFFYNESITLAKIQNNKKALATNYYNLGCLYEYINLFSESNIIFNDSLKLAVSINDIEAIIRSFSALINNPEKYTISNELEIQLLEYIIDKDCLNLELIAILVTNYIEKYPKIMRNIVDINLENKIEPKNIEKILVALKEIKSILILNQ